MSDWDQSRDVELPHCRVNVRTGVTGAVTACLRSRAPRPVQFIGPATISDLTFSFGGMLGQVDRPEYVRRTGASLLLTCCHCRGVLTSFSSSFHRGLALIQLIIGRVYLQGESCGSLSVQRWRRVEREGQLNGIYLKGLYLFLSLSPFAPTDASSYTVIQFFLLSFPFLPQLRHENCHVTAFPESFLTLCTPAIVDPATLSCFNVPCMRIFLRNSPVLASNIIR